MGIGLPAAARADSVVVRSGHLSFGIDDPEFFVLRGDGLLLMGGSADFPERAMWRTTSPFPGPPGPAAVDLTVGFGGEAGEFRLGVATAATIDGIPYLVFDDVPGRSLALRGTFLFDAPVVDVPPGDLYTVTGPFLFRGRVAGFEWDGSVTGPPLFETDLSGRGTVRLDPEGVLLTFHAPEPIPEPATIVFLATGVAGLWVRQRRRTKTGPSRAGPG